MATPDYSGQYNRRGIYRGDTLKPLTILVETDAQPPVPIVPVAVCAQLRNDRGKLVHTFATVINAVTGEVTIDGVPSMVTRGWRVGQYVYDVQYMLADGTVRTYLHGTLTISEDVSQCH